MALNPNRFSHMPVAGLLLLGFATAASAATAVVEVNGIEGGVGRVYVGICRGGLGPDDCVFGQSIEARDGRIRVQFPGTSPGTYAVAAYQDLNGNGRLDRTPLGLPLEPYGFSGGAGLNGRPSYAQAAFSIVEPGVLVQVRLSRLRQPPRDGHRGPRPRFKAQGVPLAGALAVGARHAAAGMRAGALHPTAGPASPDGCKSDG